jgi:hypothetical protein
MADSFMSVDSAASGAGSFSVPETFAMPQKLPRQHFLVGMTIHLAGRCLPDQFNRPVNESRVTIGKSRSCARRNLRGTAPLCENQGKRMALSRWR